MQMHRPTLRTGLDLTDGVIEFRDESICSSGIAFGIPLVGSLCLSDRLRMEPNAWSGQRIVRGSGAAPRTRERSLLFPDLDHRCVAQSPYSTPIRHPHRLSHPSFRADDRQARHVLQQADGGLLLRLFCASVSSGQFYISPSHEHKFPLAEVEWLRKLSIFIFVTVILASVLFAHAQQPKKVPRIGYQGAGSTDENEEAFREGLRELGYVEGQNIVIEWRFAEGKPDQVPRNAAELVRLKVDVIVTGGPTDTRAAKGATSTIPIVMTNESDPVGTGLVASLSRPGGNITGLATLSAELDGKRLELLKETLPRLSHVVALRGPGSQSSAVTLKETEVVARSLGLKLQFRR